MNPVFAVETVITLPGVPAVPAHWITQKPATEPWPNDAGTYSLSKSRARGSVRFDELPLPPRADMSWPPPGTMIDFAPRTFFGVRIWTVVGVDSYDDQIAHVTVSPSSEGD
jgi:hypothetical protein